MGNTRYSVFFFSSRRRHTIYWRDWSSDVCSSDLTEEAMWRGVAAVRQGGRVGDVSAAVQAHLEAQSRGYGIVRDYTGHGIASALHHPPDVANSGRRGRGARIVEGHALSNEPMVVLGDADTETAEGEGPVATAVGSLGAHLEDPVA